MIAPHAARCAIARDHSGDGARRGSAGPQDLRNTGAQELRNTGAQERRNTGPQELRSSGTQDAHRRSGGRAPKGHVESAPPPASVIVPPWVADVTDEMRQAAFPDVHGHAAHDRHVNGFVLFDQLEWRAGNGPGTLSWSNTGWVGGDINRLWFRTEGDVSDAGAGRRPRARAVRAGHRALVGCGGRGSAGRAARRADLARRRRAGPRARLLRRASDRLPVRRGTDGGASRTRSTTC